MNYARVFVELVKFEHTLFALPFAYTGMILAAGGLPTFRQFLFISLAMVGARTAGMALNRLIDHEIDGKNVRTKSRALPSGALSRGKVWALVICSYALFFYSAFSLNMLCFYLSPIAAVLLFLYSYLKRYTWFTHIILGLILGISPVGGWLGVRGSLDLPPLILAAAVTLWVAGFDVLYACQDVEFDKREGLFSIPGIFGIPRALVFAKFFHVLTVSLLVLTGYAMHLRLLYFAGIIIVCALLIYEHSLIKPGDLSRLDVAFFNVNGWVSMMLLVFTFLSMAIPL